MSPVATVVRSTMGTSRPVILLGLRFNF